MFVTREARKQIASVARMDASKTLQKPASRRAIKQARKLHESLQMRKQISCKNTSSKKARKQDIRRTRLTKKASKQLA